MTPPEGRPISSFLLAGSHARTSTDSSEPEMLIVVATPGTKSPTTVSTVSTMLYLKTLPAAPDAAETASSATNSCSLPEPGAGITAIWSAPASVTKMPMELPSVPGVLAAQLKVLVPEVSKVDSYWSRFLIRTGQCQFYQPHS